MKGLHMKRSSGPIIAASVTLGLACNWLLFGKLPGISVLLFCSLVIGGSFMLAHMYNHRLDKTIYWLAAVILFFASMVFIRANPALLVMNMLAIFYLLLMLVRLACEASPKLRQFKLFQYANLIVDVPLKILNETGRFLVGLVSNRAAKESKSSTKPILRGVLLSVPILAVFLILLSSADPVFKQYVGSLFNPHLSGEVIFRWGLTAFVATLFMGAYALIFMPSSEAKQESLEPDVKRYNLGVTEASIVLGSVATLFLIFVAIQFAYLFGGSDLIANTGYTYADYARKGFFELMAVAAISLALIVVIKNTTTSHSKKQKHTFKWLSGILIAEVLVIMVSAHQRLSLYEEAYGFTILRLLSHLFIFWLAVAFGLLAYNIIREKSNQQFAFQLFVSALGLLAVVNIINPDAFVTKQNIARYNEVGKLDAYYLSTLSADSAPVAEELLNSPNQYLQKSGAYILNRQELASSSEESHWQSTNLARWRADQIYTEHDAQIDATPLLPDDN